MQLATLENDFLVFVFLRMEQSCILFILKLDKELLWSGYDKVWARHAPVLFPIVVN
ncbi:MAG: hypothetical protein IPG89_15295 [Bacteroidetes bacterium]|nr:hypothetical protein [Bacteroidota bacterium]